MDGTLGKMSATSNSVLVNLPYYIGEEAITVIHTMVRLDHETIISLGLSFESLRCHKPHSLNILFYVNVCVCDRRQGNIGKYFRCKKPAQNPIINCFYLVSKKMNGTETSVWITYEK